MTPLQSFNLIDRLVHAIAIMDETGHLNENASCYMLWTERWKDLRQELVFALNTAKAIEIND